MKKMNFLKVSAIALSMFMVSSCSEDNVFFNVCDEDVAGCSNTSKLLTRSSFSEITSLDIDKDVNTDGVLVVPANTHYMIYSGSNKPTDHRIVIEDGGMVTLAGVNITAIPRDNYNNFSGITCEGNARIYLADGTENKIKGGGSGSAGIEAGPIETTLTIKGITGKLEAFGEDGAAIGSKCGFDCGNIVIEGGIIIAKTAKRMIVLKTQIEAILQVVCTIMTNGTPQSTNMLSSMAGHRMWRRMNSISLIY